MIKKCSRERRNYDCAGNGAIVVSAFRRNRGRGVDNVIFSQEDIDLIRLLRWCRYLAPQDLQGVFQDTAISNLEYLHLLRRHKASGTLVLTTDGNLFLDTLFDRLPSCLPPSYKAADIARRLRLSRIMLTGYRASLAVFTTAIDALTVSPSMFLPSNARGRGTNPWGSTRIAAIIRLGDWLCGAHYICPEIGKLCLNDELIAFSNNTASITAARRALIFAGTSYEDILAELERSTVSDSLRLVHYGEAYHTLQLPVFLLPCSKTGATQLQIMSIPNYRKRLTQLALKSQYQPPPVDVPVWDAIFNGQPLVMAADMDLRRIDAAIEEAQARGYPQVAIVALEEQADALLYVRYRDLGKARLFVLTDETLTELFNGAFPSRSLSQTPYFTQKGDPLNAPLIQTPRKDGRLPGK